MGINIPCGIEDALAQVLRGKAGMSHAVFGNDQRRNPGDMGTGHGGALHVSVVVVGQGAQDGTVVVVFAAVAETSSGSGYINPVCIIGIIGLFEIRSHGGY